MEDNSPVAIVNYIFNDVFGVDNPFSLEEVMERFCDNIPLPRQVKCAKTGVDTWVSPLEIGKAVNKEAARAKLGIEDWSRPKQSIKSMDELLALWDEVNFQSGEKYQNSTNVEKSDSIMASANVYYSSLIGNSKNICFSYNDFNCTYLLASRGNNSCTLGVRMMESAYCSSGFAVNFSSKVSRSLFVNDCFDLYECMFCYNIASKRYCIANMQFEKDEYFQIKKMVIEWVLKNYGV